MARRTRDSNWNRVRTLRRAVEELGIVKLRVSLREIPASLVVEVYNERGDLLHLSETQASTEWQTVTEWLLDALTVVTEDIKEDTNGDRE